MKNTYIKAKTLCCISMLVLILAGCATYKYSYPLHKEFAKENISKIQIGMTSEEVKSIFGRADEEYDGEFGESVGNKWVGHVWLYFTEIDQRFKYVKRYKKQSFVFYNQGGQLYLNHWILER